jgi:hypothetical protein
VIECIVLCGVFTLLVVPPLLRDPLRQIASYPPEIRERVKRLPRYAGLFAERVKRHIAKKIIAAVLLCALFAALSYLAGKRSFGPAFLYVFTMFTALNVYDLVVLDLCWFCRSKRVRIPGTEDMDGAYKSPAHHIVGALKGLAIGAAVSTVSGAVASLIAM